MSTYTTSEGVTDTNEGEGEQTQGHTGLRGEREDVYPVCLRSCQDPSSMPYDQCIEGTQIPGEEGLTDHTSHFGRPLPSVTFGEDPYIVLSP